MNIQPRFFIIVFIVMGIVFIPVVFVSAEITSQDVLKQRARLEIELKDIEEEIEVQRGFLEKKQRESVSLERDIIIFDTKINKAELSIKARNIVIGNLKESISNKELIISQLTEKLVREKESLSQLIRKTREIDSYSIVEVILGTKNLSEFFLDIDSFISIKAALQESFKMIEITKREAGQQKSNLESEQGEEEELRQIQKIQKNRIEENKSKKNDILKITKGEETKYQQIVKAKEKDAATIRTALFTLRGSDAIPFEKALDLANLGFKKTGVRPALILAIIANESRMGEYIGTGHWRTDMCCPASSGRSDRDRPIFLEITSRLGLDPNAMPVSKKPWYGWGGAMGPAQFIPSTWILFEDRIAKLVGHTPPNPWEPLDAFIASALLLKDNGAAKGGYQAERLAALRYFAGWKNATKASYAFYGDDVMSLTSEYQDQIDILQGS